MALLRDWIAELRQLAESGALPSPDVGWCYVVFMGDVLVIRLSAVERMVDDPRESPVDGRMRCRARLEHRVRIEGEIGEEMRPALAVAGFEPELRRRR